MTRFGLVRRVVAAPKSASIQLALVALGVVLAAAARWLVDGGMNGAPFATFVPVVLLAAIFLQWPYAVAAALGSLAMVIGVFGDNARIQFTVTNYILWGAFAFVATFMIIIGHVLRQTILELNTQSEKVRTFNAELQHRTKNTLQIVRGLASRAARATDPVEFYNALSGRLDAMAKANELLGYGDRRVCEVGELVGAAMQPFHGWAIDAAGPRCSIAADPGMQLMMALHELGTNATKYGALSADGGRVTIGWSSEDGQVVLDWSEVGGPPVGPPTKKGLGSRILSPGGALRAVELHYHPHGVACRLVVAGGRNL